MYELAALVPPFNGFDMNSLCKNVIRGYFSDVLTISKNLMKIIRSMLNVSPKQRPTAKELLELSSVLLKKETLCDKETHKLLSTIIFDNKVSALRKKLPESRYTRKLSADSIKENLSFFENDSKITEENSEKEIFCGKGPNDKLLPRIPLNRALPPKAPRMSNAQPTNPQNYEIKSPVLAKIVPGPTIITHSPRVSPQIKRVGSLILEPRRYHSPNGNLYERVASLVNLDKPSPSKPSWWG